MIDIIGKTGNGKNVYITFRGHKHMVAHSDVSVDLIKEAIGKIDFEEGFKVAEIEFDHIIGNTSCVEVDANDVVEYHQRIGRLGETPFVKKAPQPTNKMVVIIKEDYFNLGLPTMITAFIGSKATKEPWDPSCTEEELEEAKAFWSTHALCYDESVFA